MAQYSSRGLTLRYIVALALIALLTIISHLVLTQTLRANEGSAAIINMSGRQRMLSQRINGLAVDLHLGNASARAPLADAIDQFARAHETLRALASGTGAASIGERRLSDVYYGAGDVDRLTRRYLDAARRILERPSAKRVRANPAEMADLRTLADLARGPLLAGLEQVVSIHQSVSEGRTQRMEDIQWAILLIVLMTLTFEAFFIFRPMERSISRHVAQLLTMADRDYLTGVLNRRAFTARAEAEIQRSRRHARKLSLLLIDVDHFKQVNDRHGHLAGDAVLVAIARSIDSAARREDLVGRMGGEEFAVLLPETGYAGAIEVAERLRAAIAETPVELGEKTIAATVSIGVAPIELNGPRGLVAAMGSADKMLYRAKDAGRNCVRPSLAGVATGGQAAAS
ncbi:diguanylate cyclase [Novosphingobium sp. 1949]|uniref:diguanylate cyclase n=1 Tax=Novosphingobium organovorum TaxID=2930092 RepID=A0ABT0B9E0_9SPHN|nr:diguanylate cyclase [Novosphingobium organovorum]MCJ2181676.1 diguanylate cyclase [Novosphingobium organovorum]